MCGAGLSGSPASEGANGLPPGRVYRQVSETVRIAAPWHSAMGGPAGLLRRSGRGASLLGPGPLPEAASPTLRVHVGLPARAGTGPPGSLSFVGAAAPFGSAACLSRCQLSIGAEQQNTSETLRATIKAPRCSVAMHPVRRPVGTECPHRRSWFERPSGRV